MLKTIRIKTPVSLCLLAIIIFSGCASFKTLEVSKNLNNNSYKRVGILVTRVGNLHSGKPAQIKLSTDYSLRKPKKQSALHPNYPNYDNQSLPERKAKYYKNITPEIFSTIDKVLKTKGYKTINIRKKSRAWKEKISEMTIDNILTQFKGQLDAILVLHYMDVGDFYYNDLKYQLTAKGFTNIYYTISMFDTSSKKRMLYFSPDTIRLANAILNDPDNKSNINIYTKVNINQKIPGFGQSAFGLNRIDEISYTLSEKEIISYAMKYMQKGLSYKINNKYPVKWTGLEEVIP